MSSPGKPQFAHPGSSDPGSSEPSLGRPNEGTLPQPQDFDQRLARLEQIVADLEGGELSLERSIERYKEGARMLGQCRAELERFRAQVEEIGLEAGDKSEPYARDPDLEQGTPREKRGRQARP